MKRFVSDYLESMHEGPIQDRALITLLMPLLALCALVTWVMDGRQPMTTTPTPPVASSPVGGEQHG